MIARLVQESHLTKSKKVRKIIEICDSAGHSDLYEANLLICMYELCLYDKLLSHNQVSLQQIVFSDLDIAQQLLHAEI